MGKADWKLKLYGGFNHQVYWGNEKAAYGSNFGLSPVATFFYVALGKAYGATGIPRSKIGNQIGSIDLGASYEFNDYQVMLYRQNFYDVGALSKLANIRDGLNGIAIENKHFKTTEHSFKWKKVIVEFFYSKDQAGYPWSIPTNSGDEDYYNNYYYLNGWSYKEMGLGSPLITTRHDARAGQAIQQVDYFINNRVVAFHLGLAGSVSKINFLTKLTYSNNYGTFGTSIYGNSTGPDRFPQDAAPFEPVKQFSFYIEADKALKNDTFIGLSTAVDRGKLLDNAFGLMLKVKKGFSSK